MFNQSSNPADVIGFLCQVINDFANTLPPAARPGFGRDGQAAIIFLEEKVGIRPASVPAPVAEPQV